ncbi:hypothetical protein [Bacteroides oleiciplenus]|uniref:hypothetical protein n=1 Tax=Bacteroides oleiciplenus TaxID=626931 RepID=UPI0026DBB70B|nr:hypothetical protein [Bacteroides oleiciplenus]
MKQERILISEDKRETRNQVSDITNKLIPQLDIIKKRYSELRAGEFTSDILEAIQSMDITQVKETIYAKLRSQVTGTMLDDVLIKQASTKVNAICTEIEVLHDTCCFYLITHVALDNGTFYIPDEALESIREENRTYVHSDKGKELYKAHKDAAKALTKLYAMASYNLPGSINGLMTLFDISDNGTTVVPIEQDYEAYQYSRQK